MKGLEALKELNDIIPPTFGKGTWYRCLKVIEKELKALEIIREKKVNVGEFLVLINKDTTYEQYEYLYENRDKILGDSLTTFNAKLSKREFEVIKESILCHW